MSISTMIIIFVILIVLLIFLAQYNSIIRLQNKVKQSKSGIDIYLNQRFDLIPNLVECVKGYSKHEREILENITKMRTMYNQNNKRNIKQAEELNNNVNKIIAIAENYPELKASEQFLNLQKNLTKIESQLQAARRIYNNDVTNYNTKINVVPTSIIASIFSFQEESLFQIEDYKKENININLEG